MEENNEQKTSVELGKSVIDEPMKVSSKNAKLALKIVQQRATITEWPEGYDVDLIGVIGFRHEARAESQSDAIEQAAQKLGEMFERGEIELADGWEKDNLDRKE